MRGGGNRGEEEVGEEGMGCLKQLARPINPSSPVEFVTCLEGHLPLQEVLGGL